MSLEDLPTELIAEICEVADKDALMALRLTKKCISRSATKSFSDQFMSSLSLIMTTPCLQRLIDICEHPFFGPGVRRIFITLRRMGLCRFKYLVDRCRYFTKIAGRQSEEVAKARLVLRRCTDRFHDEQALEKEGGATELLTRAFCALKTWVSDVELLIVPIYGPHAGAIFLDSNRYEPHDENAKNNSLTSTLQPCLEATRINKMGLSKFDVSVRKGWNTDKKLGLDLNLDSFSEEEMKRFSMLRSITFELSWSVRYKTKRAMATIVSQACELEVLRLSHGDAYWSRYDNIPRQLELSRNALQSVKSDRIQSISLTEILFSEQPLLEFLRLHRNSLRSLRLTSCALHHGSWSGVISYLQESLPHPSSLKIERLYDIDSDARKCLAIAGFGGEEGRECVEGEEKVQAALSAMIERPLDDPLTPPGDVHDDETLDE
ncbi:hypothetical protein M436DRAFT_80157 [Aureobasidium namibiae CBS 147.97]|uniref:F-box domain-containing protein n=1 Tax=Aureobasidium namibiae CBS 147.97 TaxID=1043004 RepID=A0A074WNK2_9PEZI